MIPVAHLEIALPVEYLAEVQAHEGVRVVHHLDLPRLRVADRDAQFLVELSAEGESVEAELGAALSRFEKDLADGELRALFFDDDDPRNASGRH